ncbi:MAG: DUF4872 domain-containing protein [Phycisphaerae bacterium]
MTSHRDFKLAIRERMAKTGERYTAARAVLLQAVQGADSAAPTHPHADLDPSAKNPSLPGVAFASAPPPGTFAGYTSFGGICRDTGALRNVLAATGVRAAHNHAPLSEALVNGLCGGVGFLYAVFEYKGFPPMLSVLTRYDTMPDAFIAGGVARLGLTIRQSETTSAAAATRALDAALANATPALCVVDAVALSSDAAGPGEMLGMAPTVVAVAGIDGAELLIDDGGVAPRRMSRESFARARAAYKKGKQRLVTFERPESEVELADAVRAAAVATGRRFFESPYKGFASNFGLAGLEKWRRLLTDEKDKKGWPALFHESHLAYLALRRTHDGIEHEFTAPAAGRPLYADFLAEAATIAGDARLAAVAERMRRAGAVWRNLSTLIATCGDDAVERGCALGDSARELFDEAGAPGARSAAAAGRIAQERESLARSCRLSTARARELFAAIAERVGEVLAIERPAAETLRALGDGRH